MEKGISDPLLKNCAPGTILAAQETLYIAKDRAVNFTRTKNTEDPVMDPAGEVAQMRKTWYTRAVF